MSKPQARADLDGHAHGSCGHSHHTGDERKLAIGMALTSAFVVCEFAAGLFSKSLALVADSGHNLTDAIALGISWYAVKAARKPANSRLTYGYHRIGILAALLNALSLVAAGAAIFWEAYRRLREPARVEAWVVIAASLVAIALNLFIGFQLHSGAKRDINIRGAYVHMIGDAVSALGVLVAGIVIALGGSSLADPIVSILIGCLIIWSAWQILLESIDILLETAPKNLDMPALEQALRETPEVEGVHDLHVWTIASGMIACSCHIVVAERSVSDGQRIQQTIASMLSDRYGITHSTLQIETDACPPDAIFCSLQRRTDPPAKRSGGP